jgi:hypothetical protein
MFIKKVPPNGSRLLLNSLFLRKISTNLTVSPEVVDAIYGGSEIVSFKLVPNYEQIDQQKRKLQQLYQENRDFKKFADNLFKAYKNPSVKSIAISFDQDKKLDGTEVNPFFQPTLTATSLMAGIGLVPFYNEENLPSYALVNKESTSAISGHQDSMFLNSNDKNLSLIPTLLLVNGYSQSNSKTWIKESSDIVSEFKEKYPSSYLILKNVYFICRSRNIDEIANPNPHKVIGEHDEINFVSNFIYIPNPNDLARFKISKEESELSILRFKEVVNSKNNRHEFVINNRQVQFLIIKNTEVLHGRDEVEESERGMRLVLGIPLFKRPSPLIHKSDYNKIDDAESRVTSI